MSIKNIEKESALWLKKFSKELIIKRNEIKNEYILKHLMSQGLLYKLNRNFYLIKKQTENPKEVFILAYWKILEKVLSSYSKYSIKGEMAINYYLGNQNIELKNIKVRVAKKVSHKINLGFDHFVSIVHDPNFSKELQQKVKITGITFYIDKPEKIILDKSLNNNKYKIFLKSQKFDTRLLDLIYSEKNKPIVYNRIARDFEKVERFQLAEQIYDIIKRNTLYRVSGAKKKNYKIKIDKVSNKKEPWVLRQIEEILDYEAKINKKFKNKIKILRKQPIKKILKNAEKHKQYDIYHSTTIEGYNITPEEISAVLFSPKKSIKEADKQKLKNKMAILGYNYAFDYVLKEAKKKDGYINEDFIKNIFYYLFKPSANAKILSKQDLLEYRKIQVYIRGSRHVPVSIDKINGLMNNFEEIINKVKNPITRSVLAHYLLVTIHPFADGNGRTARLLMNYILVSSGYSWVTITAEKRLEYFKALETAQVKNDITPFFDFVFKLLSE